MEYQTPEDELTDPLLDEEEDDDEETDETLEDSE